SGGRANSICSSCIALVNTYVLQKALEVGAPLVAGGYLQGQLPQGAATVALRPGVQTKLRTSLVERFARAFGEEARTYFELRATEGEVVVIHPMLGCSVTEEDILAALVPFGWTRPRDTGVTSTNCKANDLGVYIH